jgi:AGCS family alanine or glycine:cation symporter
VTLLSGDISLDGIPLTLYAFEALAGAWASKIIAVSINLFAFATVISQSSYGLEAIGFLSTSKWLRCVYLFFIFISSVIGSVISTETMWQMADILVSSMTSINVLCLCKYMCGKKGKVIV